MERKSSNGRPQSWHFTCAAALDFQIAYALVGELKHKGRIDHHTNGHFTIRDIDPEDLTRFESKMNALLEQHPSLQRVQNPSLGFSRELRERLCRFQEWIQWTLNQNALE